MVKHMIKLRIWREAAVPGLSGYAVDAITCLPVREATEEETHRGKGNEKSHERDADQVKESQQPPKASWKRQGTNYLKETLEGAQPCHNSDFQPPRL